MGRYWDHKGPQQEAHDRLYSELVPIAGPAETLEGELLRAAGKMGYEAYNNGFGNNISGALIFLKEHLPGFRQEWWDELSPYVTGRNGGFTSDHVYEACEAIVDATVTHVLSKGGNYSESPCDMFSKTVKETGTELDMEEDEWGYTDEDEESEEIGLR